MFRRGLCLALAAIMSFQAVAMAAEAPIARAGAPTSFAESSGSVTIQRGSNENPIMEVAKSVYWGAAAGSVLGLAVMLADKSDSGEPLRWGFVIGAFGGLAAGIYFVSRRPQPASLLELQDGRLATSPVPLAAIEPIPGGARVRAIGVRF